MSEKSLQEIPRVWREQYEKGLMAFQRNNLDYAISILTQVLEKEPAFYDCRQALRATQFKKAGEKSGFFKRMLGSASNSPMVAKGQMALRNNPLEALNIAEQILNSDPNSSSAHKLLADAAMAVGFPKSAILSLEILVKNSRDKEVVRELADAYAQMGQTAKAEQLFQELIRNNPGDTELSQAYKNLAANRVLSEGGYDALADGEGSYRDILRNKEEAVALEQENRSVRTADVATNLIAEYEARLQNEPANLKLMRMIAEMYAQKNEFDQAIAYYNHILQVSGTADPAIEKLITDTASRKYDYLISQLDTSAPDYNEQLAALKAEKESVILEECKKRVERYPTDLQLRFELGQRYFNAGKISEAIQELQKAQNNPNRRVASMHLLGNCFAHRGMNDLAARTLQNALKEKTVFDEEKKDLIYSLGSVLEKMGKAEEAIEQFKQIYEVDIGYKDVAAKVDSYYAG
ncbi:MAG: tetratricopeptide repeat protein [Verrucomicrobia bacterium]|nr:tetratricopeptide repeat protein [Verrucomicrobiota bacterium]